MDMSKNVKVLINERSLEKSAPVSSSCFTDEDTEAQTEEMVDAGLEMWCPLPPKSHTRD